MSSKGQRLPKSAEGSRQSSSDRPKKNSRGNANGQRGRPTEAVAGNPLAGNPLAGNPLAEPVYHSTAALGHQLEALRSLEFDAEGTVIKALEESETARVHFAERVAEAVNVSKRETKYADLISLNVPVQATISQEVEGRMARLRSSEKQVWQRPSKASDVPAPNVLHAFTPDLIMEKPITDLPVSASRDLRPEPCSLEPAFDLYRHMQCWDL